MEAYSENQYGFSRRVQHVLEEARTEARRRGHEYVGTEHILLGIIADGGGVAVAVLDKLDVDQSVVVAYLDAIAGGRASASPGDPNLPFTTRAKTVLELSMAEARKLGHGYVGTEHLLLALVAERLCPAGQVLTEVGVTYDAARAAVLEILGP